jgi:hypothetical protein
MSVRYVYNSWDTISAYVASSRRTHLTSTDLMTACVGSVQRTTILQTAQTQGFFFENYTIFAFSNGLFELAVGGSTMYFSFRYHIAMLGMHRTE